MNWSDIMNEWVTSPLEKVSFSLVTQRYLVVARLVSIIPHTPARHSTRLTRHSTRLTRHLTQQHATSIYSCIGGQWKGVWPGQCPSDIHTSWTIQCQKWPSNRQKWKCKKTKTKNIFFCSFYARNVYRSNGVTCGQYKRQGGKNPENSEKRP